MNSLPDSKIQSSLGIIFGNGFADGATGGLDVGASV
eukprot:CAMPEP_0168533968 /NCGR_PEP_ID=MMETSP0405-20121227/17511_1 /TAXON_ID=498012 /ORGANISM="Trichosphaerium sp, Strain Am-I-7 wt" /LENGTH=35 /DNA_ID= /DNA_START= /DNA_END= /DNA_ORIENTATION=